MIRTGSDFSGVGAFEQALKRNGMDYQTVFACDMDKYARESFIANYGEPEYYPWNVYDREIPKEPLDVYMNFPTCKSFSVAGKRKGKDSDNGVLFFNSHEFIKVNKPRYFIFENVKGLLSDDGGKTFSEWCNMLGGKSINGMPGFFPYPDSVPYHIYHTVLNSKKHGVPQNRERVFIVGIRDDEDNDFTWPKEEHLKLKLKDVLEDDVDEKYFLSERMLRGFLKEKATFKGKLEPLTGNEDAAKCVTTSAGSRATDNYIKIGHINQDTQASQVYSSEGVSPTLSAGTHGYAQGYVKTGGKVSYTENDDIRRLTPRECFRLQDFPDTFKFVVSDTQLYKQAGNSITVGVLAKILEKLNLQTK